MRLKSFVVREKEKSSQVPLRSAATFAWATSVLRGIVQKGISRYYD